MIFDLPYCMLQFLSRFVSVFPAPHLFIRGLLQARECLAIVHVNILSSYLLMLPYKK